MKNLLLAFTFVLLVTNAQSQNQQQKMYLLKAGKLYDSEKNVFLKNQQILIQGNKIKAVGDKLTIPKGTEIIDLPNSTVTPGLIDAHTHILTDQKFTEELVVDAVFTSGESRVLRGAGFAKSYLNAGFTAIRDLGNSGFYLDIELAKAINRGYVEGPRMQTSGPIISDIDGQFYNLPPKDLQRITDQEYRTVKNAADAELAVEEHANQRVDVIKIIAGGDRVGLSIDEMKTIVKTAHDRGLKVTAHANYDQIIRKAIDAGVDGIEHAYSVSDSTLELMAKKGVYMVPTDVSLRKFISYKEAQNIKEYNLAELKKELKPLEDRIQRALKKGVLIVAGSDAYFALKPTRGDDAKETLAAYFEEGLTPVEVLKTATYNASIALNSKGSQGVIKENALADIAVFNGDLEKDFKQALFDVNLVIKDGKIVYQKK